MQEALKLFREISNDLKWFYHTDIYLFFTKEYVFRKKIQTVDLKVAFPEYEGGCNYDKALNYIKNKFLSVVEVRKFVFIQVMNCLDLNQMQEVFNATVLFHIERLKQREFATEQ